MLKNARDGKKRKLIIMKITQNIIFLEARKLIEPIFSLQNYAKVAKTPPNLNERKLGNNLIENKTETHHH